MLFRLLYNNLCVMTERAEQMEEMRGETGGERREVEGRRGDEKSDIKKGKRQIINHTHALVIQRRQNNRSLDCVQHYFPELFEDSFQHSLLANLGE